MKSEVLAVNRQTRYAAVRTPSGITVFALRNSAKLSEGDILSGDLDSAQDADHFFNESQGEAIDVVILATHCSDDGAVQLLFV